jgi:hypothetical protein
VAVLALAQGDLADDQRAHALRVLLGLLTTQEHKTDAVHENGTLALTLLARTTPSDEVRKLSCQCLGSLAQVRKVLLLSFASAGIGTVAATCNSYNG